MKSASAAGMCRPSQQAGGIASRFDPSAGPVGPIRPEAHRVTFRPFLFALVLPLLGFSVPARANDGFSLFWERFVDAMQIDDRDMERRLTKFPLAVGGELYEAEQFSALADRLFDVDARVCLITGTPLRAPAFDGTLRYAVFCRDGTYVFDRSTGVWKLAAVRPRG